MKAITSTLFILAIQIGFSQTVTIPDPNFKAALLAHDPVIDTNADGEIQVSEASAITFAIYVNEKNISDMTGIEAFTNTLALYCHENQITNLNLENNTALYQVIAWSNQIESINVSNSPNLFNISISENNLTSLDVKNNPALKTLVIGYNSISSIDLSHNPLLETFSTLDNPFVSLDLSASPVLTFVSVQASSQLRHINIQNGNTAGLRLYLAGVPSMECVRVDSDILGAIPGDWTYPEGTHFSDSCTMGMEEISVSQPEIYPNPVRNQFNVKHSERIHLVEIYTLSGQKLVQKKGENIQQINVNQLSKGTYLVRIQTQTGKIFTEKIIIK